MPSSVLRCRTAGFGLSGRNWCLLGAGPHKPVCQPLNRLHEALAASASRISVGQTKRGGVAECLPYWLQLLKLGHEVVVLDDLSGGFTDNVRSEEHTSELQ